MPNSRSSASRMTRTSNLCRMKFFRLLYQWTRKVIQLIFPVYISLDLQIQHNTPNLIQEDDDNPRTLLSSNIYLYSSSQESIIQKVQTPIGSTDELGIKSKVFEQIVEKLLQGVPPSDQEFQQLNEDQQEILNQIESKKHIITRPLNENIQKSKQQNNKRIEEKQKFFFKKVIKHLLMRFKTKGQIKKTIKKKERSSMDEQFYKYYFEEISQRIKIKMENFLHPEKYKLKKEYQFLRQFKQEKKTFKSSHSQFLKGLKTMNQTYINLILQSKLFLRDVREYLNTSFFTECQSDRKQKISKLVQKLERIKSDACQEYLKNHFEYGEVKSFIKKKVSNYISDNPKCKLPWSDIDIRETYDFIQKLLEEAENSLKQQ